MVSKVSKVFKVSPAPRVRREFRALLLERATRERRDHKDLWALLAVQDRLVLQVLLVLKVSRVPRALQAQQASRAPWALKASKASRAPRGGLVPLELVFRELLDPKVSPAPPVHREFRAPLLEGATRVLPVPKELLEI